MSWNLDDFATTSICLPTLYSRGSEVPPSWAAEFLNLIPTRSPLSDRMAPATTRPTRLPRDSRYGGDG
jgi:hypothetical protein